MRAAILTALIVAAIAATPAAAWTRPGHMVAAAIVWDELARTHPETLGKLTALLAEHPDKGPFQVAIDRTEGEARDQRLFLESARWPDDIRTGPHDRPTWHYRLRPVVERGAAATPPHGAALEAIALNAAVLADPAAPAADRAVALCWLMHVVPDIHQPLHSAERVGPDWPAGDQAGSKAFALDPQTGKPISLHWFWDDLIHRDGAADAAFARARALAARHPRASLRGLAAAEPQQWLDESHALARTLAYRADAPRAVSPETARAATRAYAAAAQAAAEERLTRAAYRLADLLARLMAPPAKP